MSFLDDVSAFGKGITQKTKDMVDVTANNTKISGLEKQLTTAYAALGTKVFGDFVDKFDSPYENELAAIRNIMSEIKKFQNDNKAIEDAAAQAAQAAADAKAARQAQIQAGAEAKQQAVVAAGGSICPKCGNPVPAGNLFCTSCGTKIG